MLRHFPKRIILVLLASVTVAAITPAQSVQLEGIIVGRSGPTMTVKMQDGGRATVVLSDSTQVVEPEGLFRKKHLALTALIPGLPVKVKGSYNAQNQIDADSVEFKGSDLKTAQDIQAGLTPTKVQVAAQQQEIQHQQAQIQVAEENTAENAAKIAANKATIAEANKRFGELGEYNILGEATVYFANGSTVVEPQYKQELEKLAQQAKTITAYILLVQGYASKVGSAALNQKLSAERAENVSSYLQQVCAIPLTNMLAPGAMGTSQQVASDTTTEGQAENRRVVVKILQNKGIAGT